MSGKNNVFFDSRIIPPDQTAHERVQKNGCYFCQGFGKNHGLNTPFFYTAFFAEIFSKS
jgi:hypothetical protein